MALDNQESRSRFSDKFIYLITDGGALRHQSKLVSTIEQVLANAGEAVAAIHLREQSGGVYQANNSELCACLEQLYPVCSSFAVPIFLHGDITVARDFGLAGVQLNSKTATEDILSQLDKEEMSFAYSAHSLAEVQQAAKIKASHVFLSPIYPAISKPNDIRSCLGVDKLAKASRLVSTKVIALGGITEKQLASCAQAGASGVAVLSSILLTEDPVRSAKGFIAANLQR